MEEMKYQIRIDQTTSKTFTVETRLKQEDALSPLLLNITLEKAIRMM